VRVVTATDVSKWLRQRAEMYQSLCDVYHPQIERAVGPLVKLRLNYEISIRWRQMGLVWRIMTAVYKKKEVRAENGQIQEKNPLSSKYR
jgi:hypothetical protein